MPTDPSSSWKRPEERRDLHRQLAQARKSKMQRPPSSTPGRVAIKGLHRANGIDAQTVRQLLSRLPERLLAEIESVTYLDMVADDLALGRTQAKPNIPEKGRIFLFKHAIYELPEETLHRLYTETLLHEAGHVLFERLTISVQRFQWGQLSNATRRRGEDYITPYAAESLREDFGECFWFYMLKPDKLYRKFPERYTFIDTLYKEIGR